MNVPSTEESEAGWLKWHGVPYWPEPPLLNKWTRKVFWMMAIVIAPEIGVAYATKDYLDATISIARASTSDLPPGEIEGKKNVGIVDQSVGRDKLTKSHAFFANMGGFKIRLRYRVSAPSESDSAATERVYEGIVLRYEALEHLHDHSTDFEVPTEEDIKALSKSDTFTKAFACIQSAWLVVQSIARAATGLPITQLELATIAFVVCGILMYLLWWEKPFGTERRELVVATENQAFCASFLDAHEWDYVLRMPSASDSNAQAGLERTRKQRVENPEALNFVNIDDTKSGDWIAIAHAIYRAMRHLFGRSTTPIYPSVSGGASIAFYLSGTLFSAFHILAWNWDFPHPSIRTAWRAIALAATCANPVLIFSIFVTNLLFLKVPAISERIFAILLVGVIIIYLFARLGLLVLIFYCFSSMPAATYQTVEWTKFLPHFA